MDSEAMGSKATGSAKADQRAGTNKRNQNNNNPSPRSSPNRSPSSQKSSPPPSTSHSSPNQDDTTTSRVKMADEHNSFPMLLAIMAMIPAIFGALFMMGPQWKWFLIVGCCFCSAVAIRVQYVKQGHAYAMHNRWWKVGKEPIPNLDNIPACYFLYVLGSGGHTAEMFELLRVSVKPAFNAHRRYLFTTGDSNSLKAIAKFEKQIADSYPRNLGGTWDAYQVHRARNIHQPLYTTWFTALYSALDVYAALTTTPDNRRSDEEERKLFKYPHLVVTNGPGTGVITALVIRFLKVFFLVPQDRLKVMFIETWAHVSTLSLTGRIFHWLAIADVYLVQHQPLADKYGYQMFDFIMPYPRHPDQDANHG